MFTGIVQGVGRVSESRLTGLDLKLIVDAAALGSESIRVGDSVSVDGVCLTVTDITGGRLLGFSVSRETLSRTLLGAKLAGDSVNLELAMLPTTRLGGHFVTGHVDGVGRVERVERVGSSSRVRLSLPAELRRFVAEKGSICIDGVSLTVNAVGGDTFEVNIIPHTAEATTLQRYRAGTAVHLEVDIIARYLDRLLGAGGEQPKPRTPATDDNEPAGEITQDFLAQQGFTAPDLGESD